MSEEKRFGVDQAYSLGMAQTDPVAYMQQRAAAQAYSDTGKTPASAIDTELSMLADSYKGLNDTLDELARRLSPVLVPDAASASSDGHMVGIGNAINPAVQSPLQGKIAARRAEADRVMRKARKILGSLAI